MYGWHTVTAALRNPARHVRKLLATENAARRLDRRRHRRPRAGIGAAVRDRRAAAARRRASGALSRNRSAALAGDRGPAGQRRRAGARPDHRPAQCRRDLPLGRGLWRRPPSSPRSATARTPPARSPRPPPARSNSCRWSTCRTSRARSRRSSRAASWWSGSTASGDSRSRSAAAARAAGAGARRRGQGPAPAHQGNLRSRRAHRPAGRDQEPERVERRGALALCREQPVATEMKMAGASPAVL